MTIHTIRLGNANWPALLREEGVIVDLRQFVKGAPLLVFSPDTLRQLAVDEDIVTAASVSTPPGFVLLDGERSTRMSVPS